MGTPQSLSEYIASKKPKPVELRKTAGWLRRQSQNKPKDMTGFYNGAWTRPDQGGAA